MSGVREFVRARLGAQFVEPPAFDLDGAFAGESVNGEAVQAIVKAFPGHVQLGGVPRLHCACQHTAAWRRAQPAAGSVALSHGVSYQHVLRHGLNFRHINCYD